MPVVLKPKDDKPGWAGTQCIQIRWEPGALSLTLQWARGEEGKMPFAHVQPCHSASQAYLVGARPAGPTKETSVLRRPLPFP